MGDALSPWPPREESLFLRFQPVFTAQGRVHEYAVAGSLMPARGGGPGLLSQRARLRATAAFAAQFSIPIDFSFEHALAAPDDTDLARRLCADLDIGLIRDLLCFGAPDALTAPRLSGQRLVFDLPLFRRLSPHATALAGYTEFRASLRTRLLPASCGGKFVPGGSLRVEGLTVRIPRGLGSDRALQRRFLCLMGCAASARLTLVVDAIDDMHDFVWLRRQDGLLFRGTALSAPLSAQCLEVWLRADGDAWRSFNACIARPGWTDRPPPGN